MKKIDNIINKYSKLEGFQKGRGVSGELIKDAEIKLNIKFSPQYKYFLVTYGWISGIGYEILGLIDEEYTAGDVVGNTLNLRGTKEFNLNWISFQNLYSGEYISFDYDDINKFKEPKIFVHLFTTKREDMAEDFASYLEKNYEIAVKALEE